ncbi:MAG: T9SS type A sorting domain-containing protein [candidate division Zixibacteria bacterium]|nr:T9SS type A sorting domain-containing protein [candidate division Zixibacteria bacterium]
MNRKFSNLLFTTGLCMLFLTLLTSVAFAQFPEVNTFRGGLDGRSSTYNGVAAPIGSIVDIFDEDGTFCSRDTIAVSPGAGRYGNLAVNGDDPKTVEDEGPVTGQTLTFMINDREATTTGPDDPIFDGVWLPFKEVNLSAEGIVSADFTTPTDQTAEAGEVVHYSVMVENTGNGLDFFTITASSSNGWIVNFAEGFHYVKSGAIMMLDIDLVIPPSTLITTDQIEFTVTSGLDNSVTVTGNVLTTVQEPTNVEIGDPTLPNGFELHQNYPNPFNPATTISYDLPTSSVVNLFVYDLLGRKVNEYALGVKSAGNHSFTFDASTLSSGVYFYKIETDNFSAMKRMLLLK